MISNLKTHLFLLYLVIQKFGIGKMVFQENSPEIKEHQNGGNPCRDDAFYDLKDRNEFFQVFFHEIGNYSASPENGPKPPYHGPAYIGSYRKGGASGDTFNDSEDHGVYCNKAGEYRKGAGIKVQKIVEGD